MRTLMLTLAACLLLAAPAGAAAPAEPGGQQAPALRRPLLLEGKKTLYQRIVTHPGAALLNAPRPDAAALQKAVTPFSVLYVYDRRNGYLEVGPSSSAAAGWLAEEAATFWPQAMTLLFTERAGRGPVLFFKDEASLRELCAADDLQARLALLEGSLAGAGKAAPLAPDLPVLASEPADSEGAVARSRFYLMPIKAMSDPFEGTKFLRVASIDPGTARPAGKDGPDGQKNGDAPRTMRTGIAFVIDTTISMRSYIEQSLNVIRSSFDRMEKEGLGDSAGFAVIAFRSSTAHDARIGYTTRKVSDFVTVSGRAALEDALARVEEAPVSTHSYNEDSLAGIKAAVDELDWSGYHSRVVVLITDAGPLPPGDPLAASPMSPAELLDYARARTIWLTAVHVLAPRGRANHSYAEKAYRELTRTASGEASYMPIAAPDPETGAAGFAKTATALAESLTKVARATAGRAAPQAPRPGSAPENTEDSPEERARRIGESIGYAALLDFLGTERALRAPAVVDAWMADMDLALLAQGRYAPTVEVAVLLTKNQLSDLQRTLQIIVDQAERTKKTDSRDFFQSVLSASAQLARDPAAFSARPGLNLRDTGVLGEVLDGLPYKSAVMLLREDDWYRMSVGEQTAFVNRLKSRIARYEEYDKDRSNWESFGAPDPGDWVYRVPLSMLP